MVVPMYISESAPSEYRGTLGNKCLQALLTVAFLLLYHFCIKRILLWLFFTVVCNNLMITFGQFVAGCLCGAFSGISPNGWKWMLGLAGVPSAVSFHNQIIGSAKKLYTISLPILVFMRNASRFWCFKCFGFNWQGLTKWMGLTYIWITECMILTQLQ